MRHALLFSFLALAGGTVFAQTANVIELEPTDSVRVKSAWDALQKAQAAWDAIQEPMREKYTLVMPGDPDAGNGSTVINLEIGGVTFLTGGCEGIVLSTAPCTEPSAAEKARQKKIDDEWEKQHRRMFRRGYENGFEFSKDFRFIVPKIQEVKPTFTPYILNGVTSMDCSKGPC